MVLGADFSKRSTLAMQALGFAYGEVDDDVLDTLVEQTELARKEYPLAVLLWMVHFTPAVDDFPDSSRAPNHLKLAGDDRLLNAASRCGVHAILSGHGHKRGVLYHPGGTRILAAGSASQFDAHYEHWAHIVEYDFLPSGALSDARRIDLHRDGTDWHAAPAIPLW